MAINFCKIPQPATYILVVYIIANIFYMIRTRYMSTPFNDALQQYPELLAIKKDSSKQRMNVFLLGLAIGIGVLFVYNPFTACTCSSA